MRNIKQISSFLITVIAFAVFVVFMAGCESREKAKEEENKALVSRDFEEVWNQGKLDVVDETYDADFIKHVLGSHDIHGPEGFKQSTNMFRTAFPDFQITIDDQIAEGDKVAVRWTLTATHTSGVQVKMTGISIGRFAGGKFVEGWDYMDALGMQQQLGMELKPKEVEK